MMLILGATGYIGRAFVAELSRRCIPFRAVTRNHVNYTNFEQLLDFLRETKPNFLINCAGFTGKPNVDACEAAKAETLIGNALLPQTVVHACVVAKIPWGHISSGCIYSGGKIYDSTGVWRIESDLTRPDLQTIIDENPDRLKGFAESDTPNFSFRSPPCSFYSGTKALGEEAVSNAGGGYIWRLRIPFDEFDGGRNYLGKLLRYPTVYNNINSISHRFDFVQACLDCVTMQVPYGVYNVTNPGWVTTRYVVSLIQKYLVPKREFKFWESDEEFYKQAAKTLRSNCVLDTSKIVGAGIKIRCVEEALEDSLLKWIPEQ